jgi:hypothetical protein
MPRKATSKNAQYRLSQIHYLRLHYAELPPAHFAEYLGVTVPKVYALARRHNIKKRAPNGAPEWRAAA